MDGNVLIEPVFVEDEEKKPKRKHEDMKSTDSKKKKKKFPKKVPKKQKILDESFVQGMARASSDLRAFKANIKVLQQNKPSSLPHGSSYLQIGTLYTFMTF